MGKLIKRNIWDFNKIFESVNKTRLFTENKRDGLFTEGDLIYHHVDSASPESDQYEIGEELTSTGINENEYIVYHGTNNEFDKFDLNKATQGIIWFTDSIDTIRNNTHGGMGSKIIMKRKIILNNPAGWPEYEKYGLGQLRGMGYDGVILPQGDHNDYIVFHPKAIKMIKDGVNPVLEDSQEGIFMSEQDQLREIFGDVDSGMDTMGLGESIGFNHTDGNTTAINPLPVTNEIDWKGDFKDVKPSGFNAKESCINPKELVDYLNRVRANAELKTADREKFKPKYPYVHAKYPYVHAKSQLLPLDKPTFEDIDLEEFKNKILIKPSSIINTNSKMLKSGQQNEFVYKTGIPAFRGIAYDEAKGEFVVVNTCPGAGECVFICYALSGNYIRYPQSYDLMTQRLNLLLNHPDQYQKQMYDELKAVAKIHKALNGYENRIKMRWNDSGDFFSKKYVQIAENVIKQLNAEGFQIDDYAYTKVANVANDSNIGKTTYSSGGNIQQSNLVKKKKEKSIIVPKELFADLDIDKSSDLNILKNRIVHDNDIGKESATPITLKSILTYNELMRTPIGDKPYWSVVVTPHNGDDAAFRKDVQNVLLTIH